MVSTALLVLHNRPHICDFTPKNNLPPACASQKKRDALDCRIEFSKVVTFSS